METLEELKTGIGNEEIQQLKPAKVKIVGVNIVDVLNSDNKKVGKKVTCQVKHPDKEEPIQISSVKYENKGKLATSGTWFNLDTKGLIQKGSALATLLQHLKVATPMDLMDKEAETTHDNRGYLCFKAY